MAIATGSAKIGFFHATRSHTNGRIGNRAITDPVPPWPATGPPGPSTEGGSSAFTNVQGARARRLAEPRRDRESSAMYLWTDPRVARVPSAAWISARTQGAALQHWLSPRLRPDTIGCPERPAPQGHRPVSTLLVQAVASPWRIDVGSMTARADRALVASASNAGRPALVAQPSRRELRGTEPNRACTWRANHLCHASRAPNRPHRGRGPQTTLPASKRCAATGQRTAGSAAVLFRAIKPAPNLAELSRDPEETNTHTRSDHTPPLTHRRAQHLRAPAELHAARSLSDLRRPAASASHARTAAAAGHVRRSQESGGIRRRRPRRPAEGLLALSARARSS